MGSLENKLFKINALSNVIVKAFDVYKSVKIRFIDFNYEKAENPTLSKEELIAYNKNRKFGVHKELCFAPKKSMIFSFDGNVYLCCENKQYSIGNITSETVHDIWFGEKRAFIDKKINTDYNLEYGCINCKYKIQNKDYTLALAQVFDLKTNNHSVYPARLDFEIHNTCNLECVMCSGVYSSSIQINRYKKPAIPIRYDESFIDQLNEFLPHVNYINLIGGEPTLISIYYKILERAIELNPGCVFHIQTNASTLNDRFRKILEKGNFQIGISIDSLKRDLAEKIRINLNFEKFMENVRYYLKLHNENRIKVTVNICPMPYNWREMVDIIRFCNENKVTVFLCIVNAPYYNSFLSVSPEYIDKVHRELTCMLGELPRSNYFETGNYDRLKDFINLLQQVKEVIIQNHSAYTNYIKEESAALFSVFYDKLIGYIQHPMKKDFAEEALKYTQAKFQELDENTRKELLIIIINSIREPILSASKEEYMRWSVEFVDSLVFSYTNRPVFESYIN